METPGLFYVETPRDFLTLTGRDRASFLQGMVTNDVLGLQPGQGCYAFHLDATGHVLADMRVLIQEDRIVLDLEPGVGPVLAELLDHYLVMERVKIAPLTLTAIFLCGSRVAESLDRLPAMATFSDRFGATLYAEPPDADALRDAVVVSGGVALKRSELEAIRIFSGIPRFGVDIDRRVLAPETGQAARAISNKKGCYVGQEIVARIDARGHTNRALAAFWLSAPVPPETPVTVDGKEVGRITSSAPWEGLAVGLGYIRNEFAAPGTDILAGETSGSVRELS